MAARIVNFQVAPLQHVKAGFLNVIKDTFSENLSNRVHSAQKLCFAMADDDGGSLGEGERGGAELTANRREAREAESIALLRPEFVARSFLPASPLPS